MIAVKRNDKKNDSQELMMNMLDLEEIRQTKASEVRWYGNVIMRVGDHVLRR